MNKLLIVAAFLIVPLAGCVTADAGAPRAGIQTVAAGTYFCWKEKLNAEGDSLVCNWQGSASDACKSTNSSTLAKGSIASGPKDANRCANGQWLVQVTTK